MPSPRDPCPAQPGGELQCTVNGEENSLLIDRGASVVFGHPWHVDSSKADALLGGTKRTATKSLINAFESNAPRSLLDNHHVGMIRDARGTEKKVMDMAAAATRRVGKTNSNGFASCGSRTTVSSPVLTMVTKRPRILSAVVKLRHSAP